MRFLAVSVCALVCSACDSLPVTADPQIQISPYATVYQLHGRTAMDSLQGGVPTPNPSHPLTDFGFGEHETDFGLRGDIGDGFAGFRLDWLHLNMESSKRGQLTSDWGSLLAGDVVGLRANMDEFRVSYAYEVLRKTFDLRGARGLEFRLAPAVQLAQRSLVLHGKEDAQLREENQHVQDHGVIYGAVRSRLSFKDFALDAEYALSPDLTFGGDYKGTQQDLELRFGYQIPMQDIEFFAGYRRSELHARGSDGGLEFRDDLVLDGFFLGARVSF